MMVLSCILCGCASPRAVLINPQGERLTCARNGVGIIASIVAQARFDSCVAEAKEQGYKVEYQQ